jgi:hypothetical protein
MTPRKPKQRQQNTHRPTPSLILASDYDSDIPYSAAHIVPPATRTNTELNLSVLRRYNPSILTILSIAANAVIYNFTPATQAWEKSGVEGTLFVCETTPPASGIGDAGYAVVVLNRRGLDNLILDLGGIKDVEVTDELLIARVGEEEQGEDGEAEKQKVMGIWIHEDKDGTRSVNARLIQQCWEKVSAAATKGEAVGNGAGEAGGRRISLSDLFGQQSAQ